MLVKIVRNALGLIIVGADKISRPRAMVRSEEAQASLSRALSGHSLYQLFACPFCVKTRRAMHRLNIDLETRDVGRDTSHRAALQAGGGRVKVPCLRIDRDGETQWMYESDDIIAYLENQARVAGSTN